MNAIEAMELIGDIRLAAGRTEKTRLLKELSDSDIGKFILKWAYDPLISYGLKPVISENDTGHTVMFRPAIIEGLLEQLAARELTGFAAEAAVASIMRSMDAKSAELLFLVLSKDLKCGIAEKSIMTAVPGLIKVVAVMRAKSYSLKHIKKWPVIVEPKLDGHRTTFIVESGKAGFFTRTGHRVPALDHLVDPIVYAVVAMMNFGVSPELKALISTDEGRSGLNFILDGEAMVEGNFDELSGALRRTTEQANGTLHVYDLLSRLEFETIGPVKRTYLERRKLVEEFVSKVRSAVVKVTPRYFARNEEEIFGFYDSFLDAGLEGAMIKDPDGLYERSQSISWLKLKPTDNEDLPIKGAYLGEKGTKYEHCLGGYIVERIHNGDPVRVDVGGGISDKEREEAWLMYQHDLANPDEEPQLLGRLIEVMHNGVTQYGSLRHPRKKCFRDDKTEISQTEELEAAE